MKKGYKFRVYPSEEQRKYFDVVFAANRWWWNYMLDKTEKVYKETKKHLSARNEIARDLPMLKNDENTSWIGKADSMSFIYTADALDGAFKKFFKKEGGFPNYKKRGYSDSYTIQVKPNDKVLIHKKYTDFIRVGKAGKMPIVLHRKVNGTIKAITLSKKSYDFYEVSLLVDDKCTEKECMDSTLEGTIGIDFGVKKDSNVSLSDGTKFPCIDDTKLEKRVKRLKKKLSKKKWTKTGEKKFSKKYNKEVDVKVPSKNYIKVKNKISKLEAKIANVRSANTHKITSSIVNMDNVDTIVVEDLNITGMVKNHHLAKAVTNANGGELIRQLEYKSRWNGKRFIKVDRFFASSQLCSECGYKNENTKNLSVRSWTCPQCGTVHDRDVNAANNIKNEGFRLIGETREVKDKKTKKVRVKKMAETTA